MNAEPIFAVIPNVRPISYAGMEAIVKDNKPIWLVGPSGSGKSFVGLNLSEKLKIEAFGIDTIGKRVGDDWVVNPKDVPEGKMIYYGSATKASESKMLQDAVQILVVPTWQQYVNAAFAKVVSHAIRHKNADNWMIGRLETVRSNFEEYSGVYAFHARNVDYVYYSPGALKSWTEGWDSREWKGKKG